jgi:hypothetical protein
MTRQIPVLLLLLAAFLVRPAAANDLVLNASSGTLQISGSPIPPSTGTLAPQPANSVTVLQELAAAATVWLYNINGPVTSCPMQNGSVLHLKNAGADYLTVLFDGTYLTVTNATNPLQGSFASISPVYYGYTSFQLSGYSPGTDFTVTTPSSPDCGSSFAGQQFLWIYPGTPPNMGLKNPLDSDDGPPIPISGNSLKLYAPLGGSFSCSSGQSASLAGVAGVLRLDKHRGATPIPVWDTFMYLDKISSWRLTAYPQELEISPSSWGSSLNFSLSSRFQFVCGKDSGGSYLNVQDGSGKDVTKPQQFVLDWSPGMFSSRRFLPLTCPYEGTPGQNQFGCLLEIVTKKK